MNYRGEVTTVKLWCSFCGKEAAEVERLLDGLGRVAICNECIDLLHGMVHEADAPHPLAIYLAERRKAQDKR